MPRRPLRTLAVTLTVLLSLSAAGCGDRGPDASAVDPAAEPTTASPSGTTTPTAEPTTPPSEALQKVRVVGEVIEDGDCVLVRDDNAITWTITGDLASDLVVGDRVQVTGSPDLVALGCGGSVVIAARVTVVG